MPDNMTPEQRSRTMARIRMSDTKPELVIRRMCFARGLRYRKNVARLPGKPDMVFKTAKVAVFIDGDFWHGWRFEERCDRLPAGYWRSKISRNIQRDKENRARLIEDGWTVLQIWEHEIQEDPESCADRVERAVRKVRTT